jgi:glycosyltransferase involved in cell wall biosynthesis
MGLPIVRKGLDLLLSAYISEFSNTDDVALIVKTREWNQSYIEECDKSARRLKSEKSQPEILYVQETILPDEVPGFFTACDCYVSPTRGESFGQTIIQAMACGLPVLVTRWGGPVDYCNSRNSYLLDYEFSPAYNELEEFTLPENALWAEPDREQLKYYLRYVYEHPEEARKVGSQAHRDIMAHWTWDDAAQKAVKAIRDLEKNSL